MPRGVVRLVATLMVVEPEPFTDAGVKAAVAPDGSPLTLKATAPVGPVPAATVTV